ncbi:MULTISPECIES: NHLP bacteriocin system secretion protein [unclassified Shinella]|jgi:HlyD family secretion protein|uniref:NHLP bacteriocin system secretion protein n=1 Tax=unclassified Shinella TaxID=2643062 RepID=UPI0003C556B2|nr:MULTISPECIES: NHLP bacteriocin system secretion protein [unclassified Shinella]MCA0343342.1 NHLP bacteriocin system secretion protein [Pseudomonadota bacterium]EYR80219.1 membrane-fusion protein [Shinella sp. DD12]MCO5148724.1 NHLP bacteriocin system secretion protein [Shinella sp.]MDC7264785.1 NHLP bacteriocin system secretion protein [Shinella sp. HY16]MDC7271682.1 NHLP bacteriocin system secretion protein [Shinella sp. YZ44]
MSALDEGLFRKEALERNFSPERLEEAVRINTTAGRVGLFAMLLLFLLFAVWGLVGRIPARVEGQGILLLAGGQIIDAAALVSGTLVTTASRVGEAVAADAVLARIDQPDVRLSFEAASQRVERLRDNLKAVEENEDRVLAARKANAGALRAAYREKMVDSVRRRDTYLAQLTRQEKLASAGAVTTTKLQQTREAVEEANQALSSTRAALLELDAALITAHAERLRRLQDLRQDLLRETADRDQLRQKLDDFGKVVAPAGGRLIEWKAPSGAQVAAGTPVASVATGTGPLQMQLYLPPASGKRVRQGMPVNIEIAGLPREQWGTLQGTVVSVSDFPATREGMFATLRNDGLVSRFSAKGTPFVAVVELAADPDTPGGYLWRGGHGPDEPPGQGAIGTGKVTIEERAPIDFLLPFLRTLTGT